MDDRTMTDAQNIPWKRLSVEAAAIVASILLAFAIDAWWNELQSDRAVGAVLKAVRSEMQFNVEALGISIVHHEEIVAAIGTAQNNRTVPGLPRKAVINVEVFEPSTGALDTLVATGLISDIDNIDLRISLGAFARLAQDLNERESRAVEFRDAARRRIAEIGDPIWNQADSERISSDVHMLNLLTMRQAEENEAIESARRLKNHISNILNQLDSSL
jgi:hypothetical protein